MCTSCIWSWHQLSVWVCVFVSDDVMAERVLVSEMQQACGRSHPQCVHERRTLHPLGDVVPEGVFYLRGFPDAHHDQLAIIESHQHVRLFLGHRHALDWHPHRHRRHTQSQAAVITRRKGVLWSCYRHAYDMIAIIKHNKHNYSITKIIITVLMTLKNHYFLASGNLKD